MGAMRRGPGVAVIIDLRAPSLLAVSKVPYHGQSLLASAVARLGATGLRTGLVVSGQDDCASIARALTATSGDFHAVTGDELPILLAASPNQAILWLQRLILELDAGDIDRLSVEHAAAGSMQSGVIANAIHPLNSIESAPLAGWMMSVSQLQDLVRTGEPVVDGHSTAPTLIVHRLALADLDDFSTLVRDERKRRAETLLLQGVGLVDWASLQVEGDLQCSAGVTIGPCVAVEGYVELGPRVTIGAYTYLRNVRIGADTEIKAFSSLEDVQIGASCRVGPYARLRNRTVLHSGVSVGNFVELKATEVGSGGRINHFAFLGDAVLESDVTVGAGVITCNHDGEQPVSTRIGAGAYVGSGTELIAPVTVGRDATIGAGSTITEDVVSGGLTLARSRQVRIQHWKRKSGK